MATNARIDDLRKRLGKEPGSRLFAQFAEELRKAGELEEAVQVARDGLVRHPNYPSARLTLARALFDLGDLAAAATELQAVVESAPDNILAHRLLGEAFEGLGAVEQAAAAYREVLALAPGDRAAAERLKALALQAAAEPLAPVEMLAVDFDEEPPAPAAAADFEAPIPLAEVEEHDFELERPYEAASRLTGHDEPRTRPFDRADWEVPAAPAPPPETPPPPDGGFGTGRDEFVFDLEGGASASTGVVPVAAPALAQEPAAVPEAHAEERATLSEPQSAPDAVPALVSPTLAELYFSQGVPEKAAMVYRHILEREPGNERARARLHEIESALHLASRQAEELVGAAGPPATRREALERTIARLEAFLRVLREGKPTWPASPTR